MGYNLDQRLIETAHNWAFTQTPVIDRNILRLDANEILFSDTPDPVAVNEAIELAKRYGTENSGQFVNGILDRLMESKATK